VLALGERDGAHVVPAELPDPQLLPAGSLVTPPLRVDVDEHSRGENVRPGA
jgi:hypothetical protein